ncbi:hypothetical protein ACFWDI_09790 [Streptomyces sp. NPDC060064]|uniref:hypothetical protein n=1 Tax=Streptomyces sp. NPDC060064 TaxID=3347049 RepID=UPI00367F88FE
MNVGEDTIGYSRSRGRGALLAALSGTLLWTSAPLSQAQAATTYWRFDNAMADAVRQIRWNSIGDKGQLWRFEYRTDGTNNGYLESYWTTQARTSPGNPGAVYTDDNGWARRMT